MDNELDNRPKTSLIQSATDVVLEPFKPCESRNPDVAALQLLGPWAARPGLLRRYRCQVQAAWHPGCRHVGGHVGRERLHDHGHAARPRQERRLKTHTTVLPCSYFQDHGHFLRGQGPQCCWSRWRLELGVHKATCICIFQRRQVRPGRAHLQLSAKKGHRGLPGQSRDGSCVGPVHDGRHRQPRAVLTP